MSDIIYPDLPAEKVLSSGQHVEVVDSTGAPFMVMPSSVVQEQQLSSKSVFVLVYNKEGKVLLQRRAKDKALAPGKWDISAATYVGAGEALESAAVRVLQKELNLTSIRLRYLQSQQEVISDVTLWISLYTANISNVSLSPNPLDVQDILFADKEELLSLYEHFPQMLTPILIWAVEADIIFK